jgi:hypothetical protein
MGLLQLGLWFNRKKCMNVKIRFYINGLRTVEMNLIQGDPILTTRIWSGSIPTRAVSGGTSKHFISLIFYCFLHSFSENLGFEKYENKIYTQVWLRYSI